MKEKKEAILRTVLEMISDPNYEKPLTIANIAKKMAMGKSTIYEYFDTKEAMIKDATFLMVEENLRVILENNDPSKVGFKNAFYNHLERSISIAKDHRMTEEMMHNIEWIKVSNRYRDEMIEQLMVFYDKTKAQMALIFKQGIKEGIVNELKLQNQSMAIEALLVGTIVSSATPHNQWDVKTLIETIYATLLTLCQ